GTLSVGKLDLTGDPFVVNTDGDVHLTANIILTSALQILPDANEHDLLVLAKGRITADPAVTLIDVSSKSFRGGDVHLVAGFNAQPNTGGQVNNITTTSGFEDFSITGGGGSTQGGDIVLPNVQIKTSSTSSNPLSGRGGNVTMVAREGADNTG